MCQGAMNESVTYARRPKLLILDDCFTRFTESYYVPNLQVLPIPGSGTTIYPDAMAKI